MCQGGEPDRPDDLIRRCLAGDQEAWAALVDGYAGLVHSVARSQGLNIDECEDVTQVVFAILFRRLSTIEDPQALAKWLMVTTRRECWRQSGSRTRAPVGVENIEGLQPSITAQDSLEAVERRAMVAAGLSRIGERCRRLLLALFGSGEAATYQVISEQLGIPIGSIGPTRARCLRDLMNEVESLRDP